MLLNRGDVISSVGERLRGAIAFTGKSLRDFSERTGIPYRTLQDYVADNRKPGAEHLQRMADAGLDIQWLLTGRSNPVLSLIGFELEQDAPIAGDVALLHTLFEQAVANADAYVDRRIGRGQRALMASEMLVVVSYFTRFILMTAAKLSPQIEELQKLGAGQKTILDILAPPGLADLDPKVDQLVHEVRLPKRPDVAAARPHHGEGRGPKRTRKKAGPPTRG